MSTDYSKKKNAELAELLKSRSLPHTGKKDELIARLQDSDAKAAAPTATTENPKPTTTEDEIDWDDDVPDTTTAIAVAGHPTSEVATNHPAGGQGRVAVSNQIPTNEPNKSSEPIASAPSKPSKPSEKSVSSAASAPVAATSKPSKKHATSSAASAPAAVSTQTATTTTTADAQEDTTSNSKPAAEETPAKDYTAHIPTTSLEGEIEKRRQRALRFGLEVPTASSSGDKATNNESTTTTTPADTEAVKALERAKRFGTATDSTNDEAKKVAIKGLDEALPERAKAGTKRGRGAGDEGENGRAGSKARRGPKAADAEGGKTTNAEGGKTAPVQGGGRNGTGNKRAGRRDRRGKSGSPAAQEKGKANGAKANGNAATSEKDRIAMEQRKKRFTAT